MIGNVMQRHLLLQQLKQRYPRQADLAQTIGISRSYVTRLYGGSKPLTPEVLRRVRDNVPGMRRRAELALRELYLAPADGARTATDSRTHEEARV